jgi:hypothetical protein
MSTSTGDDNTSTDGKGIKNALPCTKLEHLEKFAAAHALPPDAQVDPKAAEMVKYYLQARKDHDFKLVDVRHSAAVPSLCFDNFVSMSSRAEHSAQQGVRQPLHPDESS